MDQIELGKRIKEARIAKKMTQSEVVGDYITRNMLSQIESGVACPSIKTLQYLAKVLDLPSILMFGSEEPQPDTCADNSSTTAFFDGKANYKARNYEKAIEILTPLSNESSAYFDEASAIIALSSLALARRDKAEGKIKSALGFAAKAQEYADMGLYSGREIKTSALILTDELSELLGK